MQLKISQIISYLDLEDFSEILRMQHDFPPNTAHNVSTSAAEAWWEVRVQ